MSSIYHINNMRIIPSGYFSTTEAPVNCNSSLGLPTHYTLATPRYRQLTANR
jgi:hypothetical protein